MSRSRRLMARELWVLVTGLCPVTRCWRGSASNPAGRAGKTVRSQAGAWERVPRRMMACGLAILLTSLSAAWAQEITPRLGYAYPAGGRQGTTFEITLGGRYLDDIKHVIFSGSGVEARVQGKIEPLKSDEVNALRQELTKLTRLPKDKLDAKARSEIARIERKIARYNGETTRRRAQPAISEAMALEVTIAADAKQGQREMRVESARGLSNPIRFCVGRLPEFCEQEPGLDPEARDYPSPLRFPPKVTTDIALPAVANGQLIPHEPDYVHWQARRFTPGDSDRFRFEARKGQRLVVAASARELVPYLADAVPGWFQATLTLYDADGNELAYHDDYHFHPDPVLFFEVPEDGQYAVEIKDAIYRGRPDFVYRITIGEIPFVTSIFPLGGPAGRQTTVELTGWNLPVDKLTMDTRDKVSGIRPLSVRKGGTTSNTVPFAVDTLPECLEKESNDSSQAAQPVTLPVIVNGRMDRPGDWDVFRIEGRAGEQVIAEVTARRLASPLDSVLELTDAAGKRLAFNDDHEDKADALNTHHADSLIHITLPADGTYFVRLGDAQHEGGPEYAYRLRISPPRADFALRVVPSAINAVTWRLKPITIFALRKDGFDGEIALSFRGDPEGILMDGGLVPAGQDRVRVTLTLASWLPVDPLSLCLAGRATIAGEEVVRTAVPADDMMQAFAYRHLVPANGLTLVLPGSRNPSKRPKDPRSFQSMWTLLVEQPIKIPAGGDAEVQARAPWNPDNGEIQIELSEPPEGILVGKVSCAERTATFVLHADAEKVKPGLKGNLIANGFQKRTETNKEGKTREYRTFLGPLPAIPFEVVKP